MEASETIPAAPETTEAPAGAPEVAESQPAAPVTPEQFANLERKLMEQNEGISSRLSELMPPQGPAEPEDDFNNRLEQMFGEGENDELGLDDRAFDPRQLARLLDERVEERLSRDQHERVAERRDEAFLALEEKIPELRDPATADRVLAVANDILRELQPLLPPGSDPRVLLQAAPFIERAYKLMKADEVAQAEQPAGGQPVPELERPGATAPQVPEVDDPGARIVAAGKRDPFWT